MLLLAGICLEPQFAVAPQALADGRFFHRRFADLRYLLRSLRAFALHLSLGAGRLISARPNTLVTSSHPQEPP